MNLILHSGNATTLGYEALDLIKNDDYDQAKELLKEAQKEQSLAHKVQTELLVAHAKNEKVELDILLVHAQCHLMNSILLVDMAEKMIEIFEFKSKNK